MCLTVKSGAEIQTANEDIICFKHGEATTFGSFFPTFQSAFCYTKGERTRYVSLVVRCSQVDDGYHTFNRMDSAKISQQYECSPNIGIFIIPKGADYVEGIFEGYNNRVSSSLIYFGKNNWWNRIKLRNKYGRKCLEKL